MRHTTMTVAGARPFAYLQRIWALRYFWMSLVSIDIRTRYRRSVLGVGWSLLRPLGMTAVFCIVFGGMFQRPDGSPLSRGEYAQYVLLGMATWQFLQESLLNGCNTFMLGAPYIRQQKVPHAIFPLRTALAAGFQFVIALSLGIAVTIYRTGIPNGTALLFLPAALVLMFLMGWALAVLAGVTATHFPDMHQVLEISLQIVFFLTPIMYPPNVASRTSLNSVLAYNPFYAVLELIRAPLLLGELPTAHSMMVSLVFTVAAGLLAWYLLRKLEKTLVFWL
jgi:ABC-type polysaccharide/polyol phosphate export permease